MSSPRLASISSLVAAIAVAWLAPVTVASQGQTAAKKTWSVPRTPWGEPDLQGIWSNFDQTPLEQPNPDPVAAALERAMDDRRNEGGPRFKDIFAAGYDSPTSPLRPSLVVDPPDGRIPVVAAAEVIRDYTRAHFYDSYEYQSPSERCLTRGMPGGMFPAPAYNNGHQILQTPGYVVFTSEMIHDARIIPLDGRPHVGHSLRLWDGDPRGHWEGDTLVIDTTNYNGRGAIMASAGDVRMIGVPQSEVMHMVERFNLVDANTIHYEVTIEDPRVYARPWKVAFPFNRDQGYRVFEYACHEGNERYMEGALKGARIREKAAEDATRKHSKDQ
jgi:hypothetical protein